ncbi:MAG: transcriptional regulator, partial [Actinobacteria bacterium]|nr:transcriptional regulator [Actinomycetota bacterium]
MAPASDPDFLVLHALRLKGFADTPAVASWAGLDTEEAGDHLDKAAAAGHASRREGRITGWALTREGRARHAELVAEELDRTGARPAV